MARIANKECVQYSSDEGSHLKDQEVDGQVALRFIFGK
jgi:hypothetical protein